MTTLSHVAHLLPLRQNVWRDDESIWARLLQLPHCALPWAAYFHLSAIDGILIQSAEASAHAAAFRAAFGWKRMA